MWLSLMQNTVKFFVLFSIFLPILYTISEAKAREGYYLFGLYGTFYKHIHIRIRRCARSCHGNLCSNAIHTLHEDVRGGN